VRFFELSLIASIKLIKACKAFDALAGRLSIIAIDD
jgi:hypothetical protein